MHMNNSKFKKIMSHMNFSLIIFTAFLLGAATAYYFDVRSLPQPETNMLFIGPCYYVVLLCGLAIIAKAVIKAVSAAKADDTTDAAATADDTAAKDKGIKAVMSFFDRHREITLMVFCGLYILSLNLLGFIISTFAFLTIVLLLVGAMDRKLWKIALASLVISACLYLAFGVALKVNLPTGFLGF